MDSTYIPGRGLLYPGHGHDRATLITDARAWMIAHGSPEMYVDERLDLAIAAEAWWGGDEVGFVNQTHDPADPVTMLTVYCGGITA